MKYININTDASYSQTHLLGGYAFHIKGEDFVVRQSGVLKGNPVSSTEAELMAIEYAMTILLSQPSRKGNEKVVIWTDCRGAIGRIINPKTQVDKRANKLWKKLANKLGYASLRHIKSHTENEDIASLMNKWCDENARRALQNKIVEN